MTSTRLSGTENKRATGRIKIQHLLYPTDRRLLAQNPTIRAKIIKRAKFPMGGQGILSLSLTVAQIKRSSPEYNIA